MKSKYDPFDIELQWVRVLATLSGHKGKIVRMSEKPKRDKEKPKFKICKKHKLAYITHDCPMCTGEIKVVEG